MKTKWLSPVGACNFCGCDLNKGKVFYDFNSGSGWGLGCHSCFQAYGGKLGTGKGQKYDTKTREKIAG